MRKIDWEVRFAALRALTRGESALSAARRLGVGRTTITDWAKVADMDLTQSRAGGVVRLLDREPTSDSEGSYRRLSLVQRSFIQAALTLPEPMSARGIARELDVNVSTISRELNAHGQRHEGRWRYDAEVAHYLALAKRRKPQPKKLDDPDLRREVVTRLNEKFSPEQVAADLKLTFPDRPELRVSHETIYQALYVQGKGSLLQELKVTKALRSGRTKRVPRSNLPPRTNRPWIEGARLSDRPAEVNDRAVPGHWEGDLVVGPFNSGIVTLVERTTRFTLIGRLPGMRDSVTVLDVMQHMIADLPTELLRTITWDQGSEMADHARFTIATDCKLFFCDPHSPWQRGTNENTNGLIRDFYPKGTNFNHISDAELDESQRLLNIRPRKTLEWRKPYDMLNELITNR